ncbi:hypothetical protein GMES_0199 [Paraglaciecola mesophila KMM 241]|uniref:Uncharacterized protein n=1 Tax=Paraglaciecola mesophila KMM 241 TaxID=1128912 RepID=K6XPE0_9ALTE|nr:DUF5677 domain-containing protein [Paraglaciecola mesophila]GAC22509.1 hypothetical protein GMES_0199 [Paraglaciecola mesophila KMM 241]
MENLETELKTAEKYIDKLRFDKKHPWHKNLVTLYSALIEFSDSILLLVNNKRDIAVPIVFRSFLEAYVDFVNLANDRKYGYFMEASFHHSWIKLLTESNEGSNPYVQGIANNPDLKRMLEHHQHQLCSLKERKYPPLNVFNKFKKAKLLNEYKTIYAMLCLYSHNNISALNDRFLRLLADAKTFEIVLFREREDNELLAFIGTGAIQLRQCSYLIHSIFDSGYEKFFSLEVSQNNEN